jgi:hypothetical protein
VARKIAPGVHLCLDGVVLLHDLLRLGRVAPKIRRLDFLFELGKFQLFGGEVKDAPVTDGSIPQQIANDSQGPA